MNSHPQLKDLAAQREALLLAEVAGWLHDMGKCTDEHLVKQAKEANKKGWMNDLPEQFKEKVQSFKYRTTYPSELLKQAPALSLFGESVTLPDLFKEERPMLIEDSQYRWIVRALGRCHGAAHIEKEAVQEQEQEQPSLPGNTQGQSIQDTRLSTPFGIEGARLTGLTEALEQLPYGLIGKPEERTKLRDAIRDAFLQAPGDTRHPINEVTLWDWSHIVAALYKAALAGAVLGHKPEPSQFYWRLLALRFDGLRVIERVSSIPALLQRRDWLNRGLDRVRTLLEYTYPLGTEVYRDENGSVFVVPDIDDILKVVDENGIMLADLIRTELALVYDGELVVTPNLDREGWWGQKPLNNPGHNLIPPITAHLALIPSAPADPVKVADWWQAINGGSEPCLVSGLRPQGPSRIGRERKISDYWLNQISGRARKWLDGLPAKQAVGDTPSTIWIDEVADINGRVCLLVGRFDLEDWLKPDGFVNTIVADRVVSDGGYEHKRASFARLRRLWETTRAFWRAVTEELGEQEQVGTVSRRLRIYGTFSGTRTLGVTHTYEFQLDGTTLSVCVDDDGAYVSNDNLHRVARLLNASLGDPPDYASAVEILKNHLTGRTVAVIEPTGYGSPNKERGTLLIERVILDLTAYTPAIPILAEPRTFMALVPANKALKAANKIRGKYEAEMNKVRNRLPLTIGLVFADSRTPLPAMLDAGRRMLQQPTAEECWEVSEKADNTPTDVTLTLARDGQSLRVTVSTVMGNGTTRDEWYPYWLIERADGSSLPRPQQFAGSHGDTWVHVRDLQPRDWVKLRPSRFDFEYLDTAARRFEIDYHAGTRRGARARSRPYYLEGLVDVGVIWTIISTGLTSTQIKSLVGLIEAKRQEWAEHDGAVVSDFIYDALREANWRLGKRPSKPDLTLIRDAAANGLLADIVELYMEVLKCKPRADKDKIEVQQ